MNVAPPSSYFVPSPFSLPYPPELDDSFHLTPAAIEEIHSKKIKQKRPFYHIALPQERVWQVVETDRCDAILGRRILVHREFHAIGKTWMIHDAITVRTHENALGGWMRKLVAYESSENSPYPYDENAMDRIHRSLYSMEQEELQHISRVWAVLLQEDEIEDPPHILQHILKESGAFDSSYVTSPKDTCSSSIRQTVRRIHRKK